MREPEKRFTLAQDGFVGEFYPGTRRPKKAVIFVGGAQCNYKMTLTMGNYLVDAGFNVLFLAFYLWGGLPKEMWHIPVDYAERAAKWLAGEYYEPVIIGPSTGAGYALLSASLIPEIHGAAGISPFDYVMEGREMLKKSQNCSVYQFHGKDYPYSRFDIVENGWLEGFRINRKAGNRLSGFMRYGYETSRLNPDSRIRVENINGPILLTTCNHDSMWPADLAVSRMQKELKERGFPHKVTVKIYEGGVHGMGIGTPRGGPAGLLYSAYMIPGSRKARLAERAKQDVIDWLDA